MADEHLTRLRSFDNDRAKNISRVLCQMVLPKYASPDDIPALEEMLLARAKSLMRVKKKIGLATALGMVLTGWKNEGRPLPHQVIGMRQSHHRMRVPTADHSNVVR